MTHIRIIYSFFIFFTINDIFNDWRSRALPRVLDNFSFCFFSTLISYFLYRRDQKIRNESTEKTKGKVVQYSWQSSRAPVVEYIVDGKKYKKALYYSYVSHFSTPLSSPKVSAREDL